MRFVVISRLTDEGAETLEKRPERVKEVNKELEAYGVKVLEQYRCLATSTSYPSWRWKTWGSC